MSQVNTAGTANLTRGTWSSSTNIFTASATGIDYLVSFGTTGTDAGLYSILLDDVGTLTGLTAGLATNAVGSTSGVILA
jgi:hypothetical protein